MSEAAEVIDALEETRGARACLIFEGLALFHHMSGLLAEINNQIEALKPTPSNDPQVSPTKATTVDPAATAGQMSVDPAPTTGPLPPSDEHADGSDATTL